MDYTNFLSSLLTFHLALVASVAVLCSLTCSLEDKEDDCKEPGAALIQCDIQIRASAYVVTAATSCQYLCDDSTCSSSLSNKASVNSPNIHFTGLFISPKVERDEVLIYNSSCNITMETEAEMECEGPNQPITAKITEIWKEWGQNTQSTFPLKFCGHWSKTIRWLHGHPPQDGDNVTVERGQTLILDTSTSILNLLPVKGTLQNNYNFVALDVLHTFSDIILALDLYWQARHFTHEKCGPKVALIYLISYHRYISFLPNLQIWCLYYQIS
ncbi:fibrocystin-like isoform X3 [Rhineura floridana]|uniref:fibrocystin-like isoform X3 n=1 Tax=Rhineura floridana TaxID=261503 RepID=UPI002AC8478C|nr:fibrocystin-like isoform X3 [Rhineura floridana]